MTDQKGLSEAQKNYVMAEVLLKEIAEENINHGRDLIENKLQMASYDFLGLLMVQMFHCIFHLLKAIYLNTAEINDRGKTN